MLIPQRVIVCLQLQAAPADVQRNLAPLLRHPALRSIIQTFLADPSTGGGPPDAMSQGQGQATASSAAGSIAVWGRNPQVLALLQAAARMVEGGQLQEGALQEALLWQLKVRAVPLTAPECCWTVLC